MGQRASGRPGTAGSGGTESGTDGPAGLLRQLSPYLFMSLLRSDQRLKAEQYVQGLLAAEGRKTLRNIAAQLGGESAQQSVHHFISGSSWGWGPVRQSLVRYAEQLVKPQAWVVRATLIPKSGAHAVGVVRHFLPQLGRAVNAQQALGAWLVSEQAGVPVDWSLVLSGPWLDDPARRARANIPAEAGAVTVGEYARDLVMRTPGPWGPPGLPVVLDAPGLDPRELVRMREGTDVPLVMRICRETVLSVNGAALPGCSLQELPAWRIVESVKRLWRRAEWQDPRGGRTTGMMAAVPVRVSAGGSGAGGAPVLQALLLAEWAAPDRRPVRFWLTEAAAGLPPAYLLRLTRLTDTVARDVTEVSERVGMLDFAGRSFQGWHRHITLASVAHLAVAASAPGQGPAARPLLLGVA
ncbi:IS701 family transposase [Streptomyces hiroshimensis]|uniref:ISXo8 transposase n=1 Tax=Streptomyces hiroshimensis TaxID=66424 RepID=A0ABQ2Y5J2_9ACTN|nr:transposase [Streptomyces hiroshimensis]GGX61922.1 putative ISXo8 transposase [Streptomyces hiroshimensis]